MKHNIKQFLIAIDQCVLCFCGCILCIFKHDLKIYADCTISAAAYRMKLKGYWYGKALVAVIDALFYVFEKEHCRLSYESELNHTQLPEDMR